MAQKLTLDRILEACERWETTLDNPGFCVKCGDEADGIEPDACKCECESCGENAVYGAMELLVMGVGS